MPDPYEPYLYGALKFYEELEALLARVERGDLAVAELQERRLRQILTDFQLEAEYSRRSGAAVLNIGHPDTIAAKAAFFRRLEAWRNQTLARFRASDPSAAISGRLLLREVDDLLEYAARDWARRVNPMRTAADVGVRREAMDLLRDRRVYAERYGSAKGYLADIGVDASFGKLENLAAEVMRVNRAATNFMASFTSGASLQEATADAVTTFAATVRFNRNNLTLSSVAHLRGLYNTATIRLCEPLGMSHFMLVLTPQSEATARGLTRSWLWQVRLGVADGAGVSPQAYAARVAAAVGADPTAIYERAAARVQKAHGSPGDAQAMRDAMSRILSGAEAISSWPKEFDRVNRRRGPSTSWGGNLSIHHGSKEFFLPVPPTLLAAARAWSAQMRNKKAA